MNSNLKVVLDDANHTLVPLAGRLQTMDWSKVVHDAIAAMIAVRLCGEKLGVFTVGDKAHRRGRFTPVSCGVSYGGGQTVSQNFYFSDPLILKHVRIETLKPSPS